MEDTIGRNLSLVRELRQVPPTKDWPAKWQYVCESIWDLPCVGEALPVHDFEWFLMTLQSGSNFELARMVIPQLRSDSPQVDRPLQMKVLDSTRDLRERRTHKQQLGQRDYDDLLYKAEKRVFLDSEIHRARVFLCQDGVFGDDDERIKQWLDARPESRNDAD